MGVRENRIENLLNEEVTALGGVTRKIMRCAIPGFPDRIVIVSGQVWFIEVKTIDGRPSDNQIREHERLQKVGARVRTVYGDKGVHEFMKEVKNVIKTSTTA